MLSAGKWQGLTFLSFQSIYPVAIMWLLYEICDIWIQFLLSLYFCGTLKSLKTQNLLSSKWTRLKVNPRLQVECFKIKLRPCQVHAFKHHICSGGQYPKTWPKSSKLKNFLESAMFCHLPVLIYLCGEVSKVKDPKYMQNKKDSRISLL